MNFFINIKDFIYYNRKYLYIALVLIIISFFFVLINDNNYDDYILENDIEDIVINEEKDTEIDDYYVVDVKGEVINPGTYKVSSNERIIDVITLAGGLTENAETISINLSKKVTDEMVILIPKKGENITTDTSYNKTEISESTGKISINRGTKEELMTISGIGKVKAEAIINYRKENGNFKSIEEIKNVSGIGDSTFEKIKDYIEL